MSNETPSSAKKSFRPRGIYISGPYACTADGWATDGKREASCGDFSNAFRWLCREVEMPYEARLIISEQRDADLEPR